MKYFSKIDKIRDKFDNKKPMTINEACFVLWAEYYIHSTQYLLFKNWVDENKLFRKRFKFPIWEGLFNSFAKSEYPIVKDNYKLIKKVLDKYKTV